MTSPATTPIANPQNPRRAIRSSPAHDLALHRRTRTRHARIIPAVWQNRWISAHYPKRSDQSAFPGIAVAFAISFWRHPAPHFVTRCWIIYCAVTVMSAIAMWYIPYFFGAKQAQQEEYLAFYAGTHQLLPARGDNPRPNLLHLLFHVFFSPLLASPSTSRSAD